MDGSIGGVLKRSRQKIGLSLYDAAVLIGVSKSALSRLENGKTQSLRLVVLESVVHVYQLSISQLFEGLGSGEKAEGSQIRYIPVFEKEQLSKVEIRELKRYLGIIRDGVQRDGSGNEYLG